MTITFIVCDKDNKEDYEYLDKFELNLFLKQQVLKSDPENAKKYGMVDKSDECIKDYKILQSNFKEGLEYKDVGGSNSFVLSGIKAYSNHHHLSISPDNVFMAILTQFSIYVNCNSEELCSKFVDFEGKKPLEILFQYPISELPFDKLVCEFSNKIQENIQDPSIREWAIPKFSTTTESDKVVYSAVFMSTMKKYFEYKIRTACGLPSVTLLGTIEDWINLKERCNKLVQFDNIRKEMSRWVKFLLPVIDKFIESAQGNPDLIWWNQIVDSRSQSGGSVLSGWLSCFCVFNEDGVFNTDAPIYSSKQTESLWPRINMISIANGFTSIRVILKDITGTQYNSDLYAGHICSSIIDNKILSPSLNWFIVTKTENNN